MGSSRGTERKGARHPIAYLHLCSERDQVGSLVGCQGLLILGEHVGHLFKCEAEFVRFDELGDQGRILAWEPIIQSDQEAVQKPGDLLVVAALHPKIVSDQAHSLAAERVRGIGASVRAQGGPARHAIV
jgi:hypothetical protein